MEASFLKGYDPAEHNLYPAVRSKAGAWHAARHYSYADLETLWRQLEAEGHCIAFQTYDWVSCWYEAAIASGEAEPLVITVSKDGSGPAWILPLCLYRRRGLKIVSFADLGVSDYTAPVIARNAPSDPKAIESMVRAVFTALPPCDVVHFEKLPEKIEDVPNPLLNLRGLEPFPVSCHGIRLCEPWPDLKKKVMRSDVRSNMRRRRRLIEKEGALAIEHHDSPETVRSALGRLMAMRRARFAATGRPDMPPMWRIFYNTLASRQSRALKVTIATMSVSGQAVATALGLVRGRNFHGILSGFEMGKWERFGPGMLLCDALLTDFSEQAGEGGYFDFSVGDEPYKKRFGSETHPLYEWVVPRSVKGLAYYAAWRAKVILRRNPAVFDRLKALKHKCSSFGRPFSSRG